MWGTSQIHIITDSKLSPLLVDCDGLYMVCLVWSYFNFPRTQWVCKNRLLVITPDYFCLKYWVDAAVGMHISPSEGCLFLRHSSLGNECLSVV